VAEWLERPSVVFKNTAVHGIFQKLSVHPAINGYLGPSELGKVKAVRKSSDAPPQLHHCQEQVGSLAAIRPTALTATFTLLTICVVIKNAPALSKSHEILLNYTL